MVNFIHNMYVSTWMWYIFTSMVCVVLEYESVFEGGIILSNQTTWYQINIVQLFFADQRSGESNIATTASLGVTLGILLLAVVGLLALVAILAMRERQLRKRMCHVVYETYVGLTYTYTYTYACKPHCHIRISRNLFCNQQTFTCFMNSHKLFRIEMTITQINYTSFHQFHQFHQQTFTCFMFHIYLFHELPQVVSY